MQKYIQYIHSNLKGETFNNIHADIKVHIKVIRFSELAFSGVFCPYGEFEWNSPSREHLQGTVMHCTMGCE